MISPQFYLLKILKKAKKNLKLTSVSPSIFSPSTKDFMGKLQQRRSWNHFRQPNISMKSLLLPNCNHLLMKMKLRNHNKFVQLWMNWILLMSTMWIISKTDCLALNRSLLCSLKRLGAMLFTKNHFIGNKDKRRWRLLMRSDWENNRRRRRRLGSNQRKWPMIRCIMILRLLWNTLIIRGQGCTLRNKLDKSLFCLVSLDSCSQRLKPVI